MLQRSKHQPGHAENFIYLVSYFKRLKTNAQNCIIEPVPGPKKASKQKVPFEFHGIQFRFLTYLLNAFCSSKDCDVIHFLRKSTKAFFFVGCYQIKNAITCASTSISGIKIYMDGLMDV